jgi:hypothetical protein
MAKYGKGGMSYGGGYASNDTPLETSTSGMQVEYACKDVKKTNTLQADNQSQAETGLNSGSDRVEGR